MRRARGRAYPTALFRAPSRTPPRPPPLRRSRVWTRPRPAWLSTASRRWSPPPASPTHRPLPPISPRRSAPARGPPAPSAPPSPASPPAPPTSARIAPRRPSAPCRSSPGPPSKARPARCWTRWSHRRRRWTRSCRRGWSTRPPWTGSGAPWRFWTRRCWRMRMHCSPTRSLWPRWAPWPRSSTRPTWRTSRGATRRSRRSRRG
ncbi:hypothetical protein DFJ74DRAFT_74920 [Hyaloraphidium curvatum]|nr:hypothetical protein DFJ74DRAFT_74920 [Hyaloraphidium curvatum]